MLNNFFAVGANNDLTHNQVMRKVFQEFLQDNGEDYQIQDALRILDIWHEELENNDFESSSDIAEPIFKRLSDENLWDFYDIRILAAVIDYTGTYSEVYALAEKLLFALEKHSHEKRYLNIKLAIRGNVSSRLLRAKYFDSDDLVPSEELENWFAEYIQASLDLCDQLKLEPQKAMFHIRKGLFYQDDEFISRGFYRLEELGEKEYFRVLEEDAREFKFFTGIKLSKNQFNRIVGANIRKRRNDAKMTIAQVNAAADIAPGYLSLVEAGRKSIGSFEMYKLCNAFSVSSDYFFEGIERKLEICDNKVAQLRTLETISQSFSEEQMEYLLTLARTIPKIGS